QETAFAGLEAALAGHAGRLEQLLDDVAQAVADTHADVKDVKASLERQTKQIEAVAQVVARAVTQQAAPTSPVPATTPTKKETDLRLEVPNTRLTSPHRRLDVVWPLHEGLTAKDPRFYVRLAAWYFDKGEVRDHKEVFIVALCLSDFAGHRDVGLALLRRLPPYQVLRVVDFIHGRVETRRKDTVRKVTEVKVETKPPRKKGSAKQGAGKKVRRLVTHKEHDLSREVVSRFGLFRSLPGSLRTEVTRYLREREADPDWFDSTVL